MSVGVRAAAAVWIAGTFGATPECGVEPGPASVLVPGVSRRFRDSCGALFGAPVPGTVSPRRSCPRTGGGLRLVGMSVFLGLLLLWTAAPSEGQEPMLGACRLEVYDGSIHLQCWGDDVTWWLALDASWERRHTRASVMHDRTFNTGPGLRIRTDTDEWMQPEESRWQVFLRNLRVLFGRETEAELQEARAVQDWILQAWARGEPVHFAPSLLPRLERTIVLNENDRFLIRQYIEVVTDRSW